MLDFCDALEKNMDVKWKEAGEYSPLVLAYIGDAVFEIIIRSRVVAIANMQVKKMHGVTEGVVKAQTQSALVELVSDMLTDEEEAVYKRGRNAKSHSVAKNASIQDYRRATGFEALLGYLYLKKDFERMTEIVEAGIERYKENTGKDLFQI